jgi:hypothetical protein
MSTYVVLASNGWGKGATVAEAAKVAAKHGTSKKSGSRVVLEFPDEVEVVGVDEMGRVHWKGDGDTLGLVIEDHRGVLPEPIKIGEYA